MAALLAYGATSGLILIAIGSTADAHRVRVPVSSSDCIRSPYLGCDGGLYQMIARDGYAYNPDEASLVAFFPLYPWTATVVRWAAGVSHTVALLVAAHAYLAGAFVGLSFYVRQRYGAQRPDIVAWTLLALGLCPPTFFFRIAYSESCFLCFAVLAMLAMERHWPIIVTASFVAASTAARPVGVCLLPVFAVYLWRRAPSLRIRLIKFVFLLPLAGSGLAAFIVYQYVTYDEPFAFVKTQQHFVTGPDLAAWEKALSLLSLEPIWSVYLPDSPFYWKRVQPGTDAPLNLAFANPIYVIAGATAVLLGSWKGWLNTREKLLSALLLFVPYATQACETCMAAQGRYVAVAFPVYLVLGQILTRLPRWCAIVLCGVAAFYLCAYAYLSALGMPLR